MTKAIPTTKGAARGSRDASATGIGLISTSESTLQILQLPDNTALSWKLAGKGGGGPISRGGLHMSHSLRGNISSRSSLQWAGKVSIIQKKCQNTTEDKNLSSEVGIKVYRLIMQNPQILTHKMV